MAEGKGTRLYGYDTVTSKGFGLSIVQEKQPGVEQILKFGEIPEIDTADGVLEVWDRKDNYIPPTVARIHDLQSDDAADEASVISSGTATSGSATQVIDTGANFIGDGVAIGDTVLNDTGLALGSVLSFTATEITLQAGWFDPTGGMVANDIKAGDSYRVVQGVGKSPTVVLIDGLNAFFLETREFVVVKNSVSVPTVNEYRRISRMRVFGSQSDGLTGILTATAQTDGTVTSQIVNGNNQTLMAIYTIPSDKNGFVMRWWGSLTKKVSAVSDISLRGGTLDAISYIVQPRSMSTTGSSQFIHEFPIPFFFPGGTDIWVTASVDQNNVGVSAGFDIILVDK